MDQSKKTMRHFYCRDVLWETFEQMANDFDCSIDYLVNEAMRYYARSKNYQSPGGGAQMTGGQPVPESREPRANNNTNGPAFAAPNSKPPARNQPGNTQQPPPQPGIATMGPASANAVRRPAPPTPGYSGRTAMPVGGGAGANANHLAPHVPPQSQIQPPPPQPPAPAGTSMPQMGSAGPTLFLIYNGQRYPVTKDQFIIGRGSKTSDLAIKDGNISRKHAAVIRRNGTFYIKDLGSTNGIDYKGMRIDNKRIDEGDVFHLCDYELRFTYRTD
jgi:hypothetical protein